MSCLHVCPSCARHVRSIETTCPFCDETLPGDFGVCGEPRASGRPLSRAAFLHHALGWTCVLATALPLGAALRPRWPVWRLGFALTFVAIAALLYADRDLAPIFGHLSELASGGSPR